MATRAAKLALRGKALSDTGTEIGIVNNADATAITIHASENVGIGNTASGFNGQADNLSVGTGSGANGITIYSGNDSSGNIFFADGTSGDDPTRGGINYNHANNSISFRVNDAPKMVIDSSGNVGIGTSSPATPLHVKSATGNSKFLLEHTSPTTGTGQVSTFIGATSDVSNVYDSNGYYRWGSSTNPITGAAFSEKMRIDSAGNVGIGTSSPSAPLQVASTPSDTVGAVGISLKDKDNAIEFGLRLDAASKDLHLDRYYSGGWLNTMSFDRSSGNVGIGTATPYSKMHNTSHYITDVAGTGNTDSASNSMPAGFGWKVASGTVLGALINSTAAPNWGADINFNVRNGAGGAFPATPAMTVKSGGKVGIGTSAPSEKLSIAGGMNMNGYEITRVGRHRGTGVYTLFTNGSGSTQSSGTVEVHSIYATPSSASRQLYLISGNRAITLIESNGTSTIRQPTVSWNGATLEVSNTNGSVYYTVKVILYEIGNSWAPTWGTLDGIANT